MLVWDEVSFLKSNPSLEEKRRYYKKRAEEALGYLRKSTPLFDFYMNRLLDDLRKGGLHMNEIGTSPDEMLELKPGI
jgi:hypothetical protein